jgi:hypothetical protein
VYFKEPNLPDRMAKGVLVDYRTPKKIIAALNEWGIETKLTCKEQSLYISVCGHPDMMIHHLSDKVFTCTENAASYYKNLMPNTQILPGTSVLDRNYPFDIAYNVARIGSYAFHLCNGYTEPVIQEYYDKIGVNFIPVKQGYSKCSVCIVTKKAIITADGGIERAAKQYGFDVLLIHEGLISLPGLSHGFIGGASGLISPDKLAFAGQIKTHIDYPQIKKFCCKHGVEVVSLSDEPLIDIGSIVPLF